MVRKIFAVLILLTSIYVVKAQDVNKIQKSWIKTKIENLSSIPMEPDTLYMRYTFAPSKQLYMSTFPGWDTFKSNWDIKSKQLTIRFDTFNIEELTDTSLVVKLDGYRKISFLAEDYLNSQERYLDSIGTFEKSTIYKANNFITPRYLKGVSFREILTNNMLGYLVNQPTTFLLTFMVTVDGKVKNVKIINGISKSFDEEQIKRVLKTSGKWSPAIYKSKPIATEMFYRIKYFSGEHTD